MFQSVTRLIGALAVLAISITDAGGLWISLNGSAAAQEGMLHWTSGDSLSGDLEAADEKTLVWKSSLFSEPLQLDLAALAGIGYSKQDLRPDPADLFRVSLMNGDVVFGRIKAVDDSLVQLLTSRHGDLSIQRSMVRNLIRVDNPGLIFLGPQGLEGWRHPVFSSWTSPPGWNELPGGHLQTSRPEAVMFRSIEFSDQCEIEVILSSTACPSFVMALGTNPNTSLRLETWDDVLVARNDSDFVRIEALKTTQRRVHLFLYVDFPKGRIVVTSAAGKKLAELTSKETNFGVKGLLFRNGEHDLTVEYLSVSRWDGNALQGVEIATSHAQLASGAVLEGEFQGLSEDAGFVQMKVGTEVREIPVDDIRNLTLAHSSEAVAPGPVQVSWSDGTVVSGSFHGVTADEFRMEAPWSELEVVSKRSGVHRLTLPGTAIPNALSDRLYFDSGSLQGSLKMQPGASAPILWQPIGGQNAVALQGSDRARFLRGAHQPQLGFTLEQFPDVAYLADDSVIPCRLLSVANDRIEINSPLTASRVIPREQIRAVELTRQTNASQRDFSDSGWKRVVGSVDQRPDSIAFRATEAVGHPDILTGDVLHFRLSWGELVTADLVLTLYTAVPTTHQVGKSVAFHCRGSTIAVHDGALTTQRVKQGDAGAHTINLRQRSASITIFRQGNKIRVSIDGRLAETFDYLPPEQELKGLLIRASIINQNRGRQGDGRPPDINENVVRISDFEVCDVVGGAIRKFIDDEAREATLTIPRFRRDQPPTHVLLAPNGDLLRGQLLGVNEAELQFESRLEQLRVPRHRVAGIIWMKPVGTSVADSAVTASAAEISAAETGGVNGETAEPQKKPLIPEGSVQLLLDHGYQLQVKPVRMDGDVLVGESPLLGECRIPVAAVQELLTGNWKEDELTAGYEEWVPHFASDPTWPEETEGEPTPEAKAMIGQAAPGFEAPLLGGGAFRTNEIRERIIVLQFWASWSGPCTAALPKTAAVCDEFDPTQVMFVPVNVKEASEVVRNFLVSRGLQFPVALDAQGDAAKLFHAEQVPYTVIIGRSGQVESIKIGYRAGDEDKLREQLQAILFGAKR